MVSLPHNVRVLTETPQLQCLYTMLRDQSTPKADYIFYADRVIRLIVEEGLNCLPTVSKTVNTPLQLPFDGRTFNGGICGVSIVRAGEAMETALRSCARGAKIGKILIQRNSTTHQANLLFSKLPRDVASRHIFLLDPVLATGGSAIKAVANLKSNGVPEEKIIFLNVLSCVQGLETLSRAFPNITILTGKIDQGLDDNGYIVPGLGDFGDRYFC